MIQSETAITAAFVSAALTLSLLRIAEDPRGLSCRNETILFGAAAAGAWYLPVLLHSLK